MFISVKIYSITVTKKKDGVVSDIQLLLEKFNNALVGPEDAIEKTPDTQKLDYEAELAIVVGKEASQVSQKDAYDYIAESTIGNDISARDLQEGTPTWRQGKNLDAHTPADPGGV